MTTQSINEGSLFDTGGRDRIEHNLKYTSNNFMFDKAEELLDQKRALNDDEQDYFGRVGKFIDTLIIGANSKKSLLTEEDKVPLVFESDARAALEFVFKDSRLRGTISLGEMDDISFSLEELDSILARLNSLKEENNKIINSKSTNAVAEPEFKNFIHKMHHKYLSAMLRENYESMHCMPW